MNKLGDTFIRMIELSVYCSITVWNYNAWGWWGVALVVLCGTFVFWYFDRKE